MTIPRTKAISLLSATEQRFYEASRRGAVDDHGAARLKKFIAQTRQLTEKYRERLQAQVRLARGKSKELVRKEAPRDGADNTRLKAEIFSDILGRFEAALGRAELRDRPDGPRPRPREKKRVARAKASKGEAPSKGVKQTRAEATSTPEKRPSKLAAIAPPRTERKPTSRTAARRRAETNEVSVQAHAARAPIAAKQPRKDHIAAVRTQVAHASARGRRNQAKRDSR